MKRFLTITLALLLLSSGMHLSIARHFCEGVLTQVVWSFDQKTGGCGMDDAHASKSDNVQFQSPGCCQDEFVPYTTDSQYQKTDFSFNSLKPLQVACFAAPASSTFSRILNPTISLTQEFPPGRTLLPLVNPERLCVFRI
jgi:hypothetical protein